MPLRRSSVVAWPCRLEHGDVVPGAIVLNDCAVIDGYFRGAIFEITWRITERRHDGSQELVSLHEGTGCVVNKFGLDREPGLLETITIRSR